MDAVIAGHEAIAAAVDGKQAIVIEMTRQFGDVLHSTLVVRHYRTKAPDTRIVWAIGDAYADAFVHFTPSVLGPHAIARLPSLPAFPLDGPARREWVTRAGMLPGVRAIGCGVHPWGWTRGDIVTAILENAGIETLAVSRRPWMPASSEDAAWSEAFIDRHGLRGGFVALEYASYSLAGKDPAWFSDLARRLPVPTVSLGAFSDPLVPGTVDGRGTTLLQAKCLIARASCFVGCGSGLSVLATSDDCNQPMVEFVDPSLSAVGIGYRKPSDRNVVLRWDDSRTIEVISRFLPRTPPRERPSTRDRLRRKGK